MTQFEGHVFNASAYLREKADINHTFNVLPISLKYINKLFNICGNELSHLIISKNTDISITKLSSSPNCKYLKQLYLIQDLSNSTLQQSYKTTEQFNNMNLPCLEILQIHYYGRYYCNDIEAINIDLTMENVPALKILILGVLYNDVTKYMYINELNLDLDIVELRIHYCIIEDFNLLRYSLARCSMIQVFCFMSVTRNKFAKWINSKNLHSLCLLSVKVLFIQTNYLTELSVYAPKLEFIQFNQSELLHKLIILDRMPPSLSYYVVPLDSEQDETNDENEMDIDSDTEEQIQVIEEQKDDKLIIAFNSLMISVGIHNDNFVVLRNAKRYNEQCKILFTSNEREMLAWPFAYRE